MKDQKNKKTTIAAIIGGVVLALGVAGAGVYLVLNHNAEEPTTIVSSSTSSDGTASSSLAEGKNKITSGGTYTFTGSTTNGRIVVDTTEAVTIVLNSVSLSSADGAVIKAQEGSSVTIQLVGENTLTATNDNDGINAEGDLIITGSGSLTVNAADDGIHADGMLTIKSGTLNITAHEGLEATYIKIDGGDITIKATDDGINAANKSDKYSVCVEINGGNLTIDMGQGDTDAIDSNGSIVINGGAITITAQSPFDWDTSATLNGGTVIVNGTQVTSLTNQFGGMMGGGMMGSGGEQNANQQQMQQQMPQGNSQQMRR
ncbi:carbohydrate-binding domain-containing protein [Candidatus Saccharibacteria bacterium]|nr:carbohydrate-binding domain-containing protein [Candidatus Saccharibacteria bacterium]